MDNIFKKYSCTSYLQKLSEKKFNSVREIEKSFKPFVNEEDLVEIINKLSINVVEKEEKNEEKTEKKPDQFKSIIYEEEEPESTEEYEVNQDVVCKGIDLIRDGKVILKDTDLKLVQNNIYGLLGKNGIGKSTLLNAIRKKKWGIPNIKIRLVKQEHFTVEKSIIDYVAPIKTENETETNIKRNKATKILQNFGFTDVNKKISELSGGWACRVRLAKAIFEEPDLLLLDEPTNMLDLESIIYLSDVIKTMKTVLVVSHDRFFLNEISEYIIELDNLKLVEWKGNYDSFVEQKKIYEENAEKIYKKNVQDRTHLQEFINKFRANAKRASLVQSKIKVLEKLEFIEPPKKSFFSFKFDSKEAKPLLMEIKKLGVKREEREILKNIDFKIKDKDRIVIIGENGAGKSTFLKYLANELPYSGDVINYSSLAYYAQQHVDNLPYDMNVFDFWQKKTGNEAFSTFKKHTSKFGLNLKNEKIRELSGGQKSKLTFAVINYFKPNLLLLDEPTNHLDIEMIEALSDAISVFQGAVVAVSHDIKFIETCFNEVYECKDGNLTFVKDGLESILRKNFII